MGDNFKPRGDYRIEISGWGLDNSFFAEPTDLLWTSDGEKQVQLHRTLAEGAIVFVRLISVESSSASVPVAYRVRDIVPMDRNGRCQMGLARLHPRSKESLTRDGASNVVEVSRTECETAAAETPLQHEEVLR